MAVNHEAFKYNDPAAQATRVMTVAADGSTSGGSAAPVVRTTTVARYASAGPAGVTAPGTRNISAGAISYSVAVLTAGSTATPTLNGVALPAGSSVDFTATRSADTLAAATLITVAGDDVIFTEVR